MLAIISSSFFLCVCFFPYIPSRNHHRRLVIVRNKQNIFIQNNRVMARQVQGIWTGRDELPVSFSTTLNLKPAGLPVETWNFHNADLVSFLPSPN